MKSRLQAATGAWRVSDDARQALVAEVERHAANLLEAATLAYGREQSARIAQGIKGRLNFSLRHAQHAIETSGGSLKSGTPVAAAWPTTPGPEEVTV